MGKVEIEFAKDKVDLFALKQFLNAKCLPKEQLYAVTVPSNCEPGGTFQVRATPRPPVKARPRHQTPPFHQR